MQWGTVDGPILCRMFNDAVRRQGGPRHLSTDHDRLFEDPRWHAHLRVLEIDEIKTVPHVPLSHPFVERLIGTIRREFLDFVPFWTARVLERKLASFKDYYNRQRVHRGRDGAIAERTAPTKMVRLDDYHWERCCRGLYELPAAT